MFRLVNAIKVCLIFGVGGLAACNPLANSRVNKESGDLNLILGDALTWQDSLWASRKQRISREEAPLLELLSLRQGLDSTYLDKVADSLNSFSSKWDGWDQTDAKGQFGPLAKMAAYILQSGDTTLLHFNDSLWRDWMGQRLNFQGSEEVSELAVWTYLLGLGKKNARYIDPVERWAYAGDFFKLPWENFIYAWQKDTLMINSYAAHDIETVWPLGKLGIRIIGNYPDEEDFVIKVFPQEADTFSVWLRIPGWAAFNQPGYGEPLRYAHFTNRKLKLNVNDEWVWPKLENGFARIRRYWQPGDSIEVSFPLAIRKVISRDFKPDSFAQMKGPKVLHGWEQE